MSDKKPYDWEQDVPTFGVEVPDRLPDPCPICLETFGHIVGCPEMDRPR